MRRVVFFITVIVILSASLAWGQADLHGNLAHIPGLAEPPDKGVFVELVKALDEVYTGGKIEINVYPWARSFQNMLRGDADFHIPSFINPDVSEDVMPYYYVPEPMGKVKLIIYSNVRNPITKADIDAATKGGGNFPYVIEVGSGTTLMFPFSTVGTNNDLQSLRKVNAGRIDAYIYPADADPLIRENKLGNIHREVYDDFDDVILVPKNPRGREVVNILDAALKKLRQQGRLKQYHDQVHYPYTDWQPHEMGW